MSEEFGHFSTPIPGGGSLDTWGAGPFVLEALGKSFRFEDSARFGPSLVKKNGDLCANPYPPERSPFWRAHIAWVRQGRLLAPDGETCIYTALRPTLFKRLRGRHVAIVQEGDEDGELIEAPT